MSQMDNTGSFDSSRGGGWFGKAIVVLLVWVLLATAAWYIFGGKRNNAKDNEKGGENAATEKGAASAQAQDRIRNAEPSTAIEIGVAYGTEKKNWLVAAAEEFSKTEDGQQVKVKLIPMGSLEAAHAILQGDKRIHVWSPASSLYREVFVQEWLINHSESCIAKEEVLALTPLVFVMWKGRYEALKTRFPEINFQTVSKALEMEGGWGAIAEKPEWGLFKFGHTDPSKSNSGLCALVLLAYDFHGKTKDLTAADIVKPGFQSWLTHIERAVTARTESTGTLMKEMVLKGPSSYDALMVYESVVIDYLKSAEGRWGPLQVIYPKRNLWSDNPYCILKTEWCTAAHQEAAEKFLRFLMSEAVQKKALDHGFRPGNPQVAVKFAESPFVKYADHGLTIDLTTICEPPSADVINNLLLTWQRAAGPR